MYDLMSEPNWRIRDGRRTRRVFRRNLSGTEEEQNRGSRKHTSFLMKYKPETNSWEDVSSFDHLDLHETRFLHCSQTNFYLFCWRH